MNWHNWILGNELPIRLSFFFGIFAVMAVWEILSPCRSLTVSKGLRWANNLGLIFLNSIVLRLPFPAAALGIAIIAQQQGWGLLNYYEMEIGLEDFHDPKQVDTLPGMLTLPFVRHLGEYAINRWW
ncbi:MAG: hypothetical protein ABFS45_14660 [Pseudomonadota bacterium]